MSDAALAATAHHEANLATLVSAAAKAPTPISNPLLSRQKLKKPKGSSKGSKKKVPTLKDIQHIENVKQDELNVISVGGPDPVEEGEVLDLADQLLEQLGGQLDDEHAAPPKLVVSPTASRPTSRGTPLSPSSTHSSHSNGGTARERLHDLKEDFKDAFLPNRNTDNGERKVGRQQARKLRKAGAIEQQQEAARAEVAAENDRSVEFEKEAIDAQCRKYKVHIKEVEPDGHCMYSSIADQANLLKLSPNKEDYRTTRHYAASYMRAHPDDFLPFLPSSVDPENLMSPAEYERYCNDVENTAEWGGEPEIRALSLYFKAPIMVIQAGTEAVEHSPELPKERTMLISYHRKMYGLGEHYNSLRPSTHGGPQEAPAVDPFTDGAAAQVA